MNTTLSSDKDSQRTVSWVDINASVRVMLIRAPVGPRRTPSVLNLMIDSHSLRDWLMGLCALRGMHSKDFFARQDETQEINRKIMTLCFFLFSPRLISAVGD